MCCIMALSLSGCLYTHTTRPHTTNFHNTSIGSKKLVLDERRISEPATGLQLSVQWSEDLIRSEAKKAGMSTIAYADEERLSVLFGIYSHRKLWVYGD